MKPRTFFGLALLIPYLIWVICAIVIVLLPSFDATKILDLVLLPIIYYMLGVIVWFIPYTILAFSLWIWSKGKSTEAIKRLVGIAPLLLFILTWIEFVAVVFPTYTSPEPIEYLLDLTVLLGGFSVGFGYLIIGIALGIYKLLQKKRFIQDVTSRPILET